VAKANHTDTTYNPLFIYGPSGMGKTHLLNAIYNDVKKNMPEKNIILSTGEAFTNELIDVIGKKNTQPFHQKFRSADILLIDDIHFIAGKDSTQEEFFHTFNELYNNGRQIVITSDRPPKEIKTLESRIRTRFEWGLIADISAPEYETRVAIIKRKADLMNFNIPDDVIECIANRLKSNIRQLEGCVNRLKALQELVGTKPTVVMAQNAIREILSDEQPSPVTVEKIINDVASVYGVTVDDIRSSKRSSIVSTARKVCAYVMKQLLQLSHKAIGAEIGGKDHSTVVYYIEDVSKQMENDVHTKETIEDIIKNLRKN
jgi:chromosomal replication initiator protein